MSENEAKETMQDFEAELEASFRKINEGDILTGTVISVDEDAITLDLKYYAPGIIKADEVSNDPSFVIDEHIHPGDVLEATVIRRDDGEGNILLSMKEANEVLAWDKLKELLENETVVTVKVSEAVKAGVVAYLYGIRGFIPASQITTAYVEDTESYVGIELEVRVITVDEEDDRLVAVDGQDALLQGVQNVLRPGHQQPDDGTLLVRDGLEDDLRRGPLEQHGLAPGKETAHPVHLGACVVQGRDAEEGVIVLDVVVLLLHLRGLGQAAVLM